MLSDGFLFIIKNGGATFAGWMFPPSLVVLYERSSIDLIRCCFATIVPNEQSTMADGGDDSRRHEFNLCGNSAPTYLICFKLRQL